MRRIPPSRIVSASAAAVTPTCRRIGKMRRRRLPAPDCSRAPMAKAISRAKNGRAFPSGLWSAQPCLHYRHGAAPAGAVGTDAAVLYRQPTLGKLDGQSQCRRQLHPHQRTRPAGYQRRCNAYDVASANRGGQRRHQEPKGDTPLTPLCAGRPAPGTAPAPAPNSAEETAGTQRQPRPRFPESAPASPAPRECVQRFQHGAPPFRDSLCRNWPVRRQRAARGCPPQLGGISKGHFLSNTAKVEHTPTTAEMPMKMMGCHFFVGLYELVNDQHRRQHQPPASSGCRNWQIPSGARRLR